MVRVHEPRLRVGLLTPHAAAGPEIEIPDLSQGRVAVTLERIRAPEPWSARDLAGPTSAEDLRALARPEAIDGAAARFHEGSVDVVAHASTTTGYALGARSEAALVERLTTQCAVPAVGSAGAAADALRASGADRVVLIHPPWFDDEMDRLGIDYFRDEGFGVTLLKAEDLPRDPGRTTIEGIIDWVSRHLGDGDEALFLAGNGFRAARAVAELEQRTNRLVLQANQVLLWSILAATHAPLTVEGFGRVFRTLAKSSGFTPQRPEPG